jgi:MOSC domain-containing protein YiiM
MNSGHVLSLHLKPESGGVAPMEQLEAVANVGFVGDKCAGRPKRQVLFLSQETLDEFGYVPGQLREQITVSTPGLQSIAVGSRIRIGDAVFEIQGDCAPCGGMARALGEDEVEFKARLSGKRGMLATVREGGTIHVGDAVMVDHG